MSTIDSVSSLYSSTYSSSSTNSTASSLESTLSSTDLSSASDDELLSVCEDFEEYFVEQMVKSMVKMANISGEEDENDYSSIFGMTSDSSDSGMSTLSSYYGDQMVTMISEALCDTENGGGLGLAQTLYEQMKRNYGISDTTDTDTSTDSSDSSTEDTTTSEVTA